MVGCDPRKRIRPSPWRTRPISSVHDALEWFDASGGEERDFSLLVVASPAGNIHPAGQGTTQEKPHLPLSASRKGKERAIVVDDEGEDLAFFLDEHHVQDKEKQLDAARRETGTKSRTTDNAERERDKERIRMLEEEVRMLKEEVCPFHFYLPHSFISLIGMVDVMHADIGIFCHSSLVVAVHHRHLKLKLKSQYHPHPLLSHPLLPSAFPSLLNLAKPEIFSRVCAPHYARLKPVPLQSHKILEERQAVE